MLYWLPKHIALFRRISKEFVYGLVLSVSYRVFLLIQLNQCNVKGIFNYTSIEMPYIIVVTAFLQGTKMY